MADEFLFRGSDLSLVLESQRKSLRDKIEAFSPDYVFHVDENELIDALTSEFSLDTPTLNIDCRSIEQYEDTPEIRDVFGDRFDAPVNVYSVAIPFSGDAAIFTYRPSRNDYKSTAGDDL